MKAVSASVKVLRRLTVYLNYLKELPKDVCNISSTAIAAALGQGEVQVRKDLAFVSSGGRPRVGYSKAELISDIEEYLGYNQDDDAILVGAGRLGRALLEYPGFSEVGVNIVAAFDSDPYVTSEKTAGREVFPMSRLPDLCRRMNVKIGIVAVPKEAAQQICDLLVENGILAIWNFAPIHINVPENILIQNENLAASLAVLSRKLQEGLKKEK